MGGKNYKPLQNQNSFHHPRLGFVHFIQENKSLPKNRHNYIEFTSIVNSQIEYEQWIKTKQRMLNSQLNEVLFLPIRYQYLKEGMCGSSGKAKLLFENYFYVLQNQIRNRQSINKPFLQTQLWYLLYTLLRASKQFEKYDKKIGDIQPCNILINSDGQLKIISALSWPIIQNNYEKILENRLAKAFLAPEQLAEINSRKNIYSYRIKKNLAEMFSIGLTLLEASTLKNCAEIYIKLPEIQINLQKLRSFKEIIKKRYSNLFVKTIYSMLQINDSQRPTPGQIHATLFPFEQLILDLEQLPFDKIITEKTINNNHKNYQENHQMNSRVYMKQSPKQLNNVNIYYSRNQSFNKDHFRQQNLLFQKSMIIKNQNYHLIQEPNVYNNNKQYQPPTLIQYQSLPNNHEYKKSWMKSQNPESRLFYTNNSRLHK